MEQWGLELIKGLVIVAGFLLSGLGGGWLERRRSSNREDAKAVDERWRNLFDRINKQHEVDLIERDAALRAERQEKAGWIARQQSHIATMEDTAKVSQENTTKLIVELAQERWEKAVAVKQLEYLKGSDNARRDNPDQKTTVAGG